MKFSAISSAGHCCVWQKKEKANSVLCKLTKCISNYEVKKWIMRINLTTFVLTLALIQASAKGFSQISLNEKRASLKAIFKRIESQTNYVFFSSDFDPEKVKVNVYLKNANINQAMDACLKELPLIYKII